MPDSRNAHHFAGLDFADVLRVEQIEGASFGSDHPGAAEAAPRHERAKAARIADGEEFVLRQNE